MKPTQIIDLHYKGYKATLEYFEGKSFIIKLIDTELSNKVYHSFSEEGKARRGFFKLVDVFLTKNKKETTCLV